jgi:hypothetical protein
VQTSLRPNWGWSSSCIAGVEDNGKPISEFFTLFHLSLPKENSSHSLLFYVSVVFWPSVLVEQFG